MFDTQSAEAPTQQNCFLNDSHDAALLVQAVLDGRLKMTERRPSEQNRAKLIKSGNVFVMDAKRGPISRWTDGISWSASRILQEFLLYREKKPEGEHGARRSSGSAKRSVSDSSSSKRQRVDDYEDLSSGKTGDMNYRGDRSPMLLTRDPKVHKLYGSLTDGEHYKSDGLFKKTITVPIHDSELRIVSYYIPSDVVERKLITPTEDPFFSDITICDTVQDGLKRKKGRFGLSQEMDPYDYAFEELPRSGRQAGSYSPETMASTPYSREPSSFPAQHMFMDSAHSPNFYPWALDGGRGDMAMMQRQPQQQYQHQHPQQQQQQLQHQAYPGQQDGREMFSGMDALPSEYSQLYGPPYGPQFGMQHGAQYKTQSDQLYSGMSGHTFADFSRTPVVPIMPIGMSPVYTQLATPDTPQSTAGLQGMEPWSRLGSEKSDAGSPLAVDLSRVSQLMAQDSVKADYLDAGNFFEQFGGNTGDLEDNTLKTLELDPEIMSTPPKDQYDSSSLRNETPATDRVDDPTEGSAGESEDDMSGLRRIIQEQHDKEDAKEDLLSLETLSASMLHTGSLETSFVLPHEVGDETLRCHLSAAVTTHGLRASQQKLLLDRREPLFGNQC